VESAIPTDAASRTQRTQAVLDQITQATEAGDPNAFAAVVSDRDSSFPKRARMIFENLRVLPLSTFRLNARSSFSELSAARRNQLGPASWVQQATVSWQLQADTAAAEHTVWLTMVSSGDMTQLAGTTDLPGGTGQAEPLPPWWLEPVAVKRVGDATVLVSARLNPDRWANAANAAVTKISPRVGGVGRGWSGGVVVEVPGTTGLFERVLAVPDGSYDQIAATTWADGANLVKAPLRIVVNPIAAGKLSDLGLKLLLAHEATHVATHSVDSPAPTWAVEGFADYVAYQAYPEAREAAAAPLLARVRDGKVPRALPEDDRFRASTNRLDLAYAEAWLACRYVAERYSRAQLDQLYQQLDAGKKLDQAVRSVLDVSEAQFVSGWRSYLSALAG
jgi:hypothetical protein